MSLIELLTFAWCENRQDLLTYFHKEAPTEWSTISVVRGIVG